MRPSTFARPRLARGLGLGFASLLAACLGLEVAHRAWLHARGRPYDAAATREAIVREREAASSFAPRAGGLRRPEKRLLHPFHAWDYVDGVERVEGALAEQRTQGGSRFDLLVVGGSVAEVFGDLGRARLAEVLAADPRLAGRELRILEFGRSGYKQPQQLNVATWLFSLGLRPDAVLSLDGFNEVAFGANNAALDQSPVFPSYMHWTHLAYGGSTDRALIDEMAAARDEQRAIERASARALDWGLARSSVLGTLALRDVLAHRRACDAAFERYGAVLAASATSSALRGPEPGGEPSTAVARSVRCWQECSRMLAAVCAARSIPYLHCLQPTLHDEGSKVPTEEERRNGAMDPAWTEGVRLGYPLLRSAGAQLAVEGIAFVDLSGAFRDVGGTIYFDNCHFGETGNALLAERIGRELLERLPRPGADETAVPR